MSTTFAELITRLGAAVLLGSMIGDEAMVKILEELPCVQRVRVRRPAG